MVAKSAQVIEVCAKHVYGQTCPLKTFPEKGVKTITAFRFVRGKSRSALVQKMQQ